MAQLDFFGTWTDSLDLLSILLDKNLLILPDVWYETTKYKMFDKITEELERMICEKRRLYLWTSEVCKVKPSLVLQNLGPQKGKYFALSYNGAPCLDLSLPICYTKDGMIYLSCGILTYPKSYLNPDTKEWIETPEELIVLYKTICNDIKKALNRYKVNKNFWVGNDALKLLKNNEAKLAVNF